MHDDLLYLLPAAGSVESVPECVLILSLRGPASGVVCLACVCKHELVDDSIAGCIKDVLTQ